MDYFNSEEREQQRRFAQFRDRVLQPLTETLRRSGITPNHVTLAAIGLLIGGCLLGQVMPWISGFMIFFYCVFDGIDGALARRMGLQNEGGALLDVVADQLGPILVSAAAVYHLHCSPVAAVLFSGFYIAFIVLALFANEKGIPLFIFLRVKYAFYWVYCWEVIFINFWTFDFDWPVVGGPTGLFAAVFAAYYMLIFAWGLAKIYRALALNPMRRTEDGQ